MDRPGEGPDPTDKLWADGDTAGRTEATAGTDTANLDTAPTKVCPSCSVAERERHVLPALRHAL
jgi:hypothetical protein